jgi:5'-nucleotidase
MSHRHGTVWKLTTAAIAGICIAAAPLVAVPSLASTDGSGVVVNEVYSGGGNTGAPLNADFVQLYNPSNSPVSLNGWSLQYRAAASATAAVGTNLIPLSVTIAAHDYRAFWSTDNRSNQRVHQHGGRYGCRPREHRFNRAPLIGGGALGRAPRTPSPRDRRPAPPGG